MTRRPAYASVALLETALELQWSRSHATRGTPLPTAAEMRRSLNNRCGDPGLVLDCERAQLGRKSPPFSLSSAIVWRSAPGQQRPKIAAALKSRHKLVKDAGA
jgi:hypothetical protein